MAIAKTFKELEVWKLAIQIAKQVYAVTEQLPENERYGLVAQMKRAAVSLSANIAEGFRRQNPKGFRYFLLIALGSAAELESYCELCRELFNGHAPRTSNLASELDRFQRMTNMLRSRLKSGEGKL